MEQFVQVAATIKEKEVRNNSHIHDDLVFSILSKLPLKSIKRFECVHKSWSLLLENPHFMNLFRDYFLSNIQSDCGDTFLLLSEAELPLTHEGKYHEAMYLLPNKKFEDKIKLDLPPPFEDDDNSLIVLDSVSINATYEFMVIPPSPDEPVLRYHDTNCEFQGFGYDHVKDDYKVIRYTDIFYKTTENDNVPLEDRWFDPLLEIYSLRSNSWRIIHANMDDCYFPNHMSVYLNGICHWWASSLSDDFKGYLISFDFIDEVFFRTPILIVDLGDRFFVKPVVLNEYVALISNCCNTTVFHISILGELGEEKSLIKLFIIGPIPSIEFPIVTVVGKQGDICLHKKDYGPVWVNLNTQVINEMGEYYGYQIGIYEENLLSMIRGINN